MTKNNKQNCWEHMKCGREPNGKKAAELGICPASTTSSTNGINNGLNAGRCCWAIGGTLCSNNSKDNHSSDHLKCIECDFYGKVVDEEGEHFSFLNQALKKIDEEQ